MSRFEDADRHDAFADVPNVDERLADWVDGTMSQRDRDRFEAELRVSPPLRAQLAEYEGTVAMIREALAADPYADSADGSGLAARSDLADRVMASLAQQASGAGPTTRSRWPFVWAVLSAAALLGIAILVDSWGARTQEPLTQEDTAHQEPAARLVVPNVATGQVEPDGQQELHQVAEQLAGSANAERSAESELTAPDGMGERTLKGDGRDRAASATRARKVENIESSSGEAGGSEAGGSEVASGEPVFRSEAKGEFEVLPVATGGGAGGSIRGRPSGARAEGPVTEGPSLARRAKGGSLVGAAVPDSSVPGGPVSGGAANGGPTTGGPANGGHTTGGPAGPSSPAAKARGSRGGRGGSMPRAPNESVKLGSTSASIKSQAPPAGASILELHETSEVLDSSQPQDPDQAVAGDAPGVWSQPPPGEYLARLADDDATGELLPLVTIDGDAVTPPSTRARSGEKGHVEMRSQIAETGSDDFYLGSTRRPAANALQEFFAAQMRPAATWQLGQGQPGLADKSRESRAKSTQQEQDLAKKPTDMMSAVGAATIGGLRFFAVGPGVRQGLAGGVDSPSRKEAKTEQAVPAPIKNLQKDLPPALPTEPAPTAAIPGQQQALAGNRYERDWLVVGPAAEIAALLAALREYADAGSRSWLSGEVRVIPPTRRAAQTAEDSESLDPAASQKPAEKPADGSESVRRVVLRFRVRR